MSRLLIIDEAVTIPIAQLDSSLSALPSSVNDHHTVQGYEGTGRGFILKSGDSIPKLQNYQLHCTGFHAAQDDPPENWL